MNLKFILNLLELRDAYTKGHTERGVEIATNIAKELGLSQEELYFLKIGGYIHDIGKIAIPDVILLKPSKLTDKEYEIMKLHVELGYEIIKGEDIPDESINVLLYHQEKYNGTGYPFSKKGKEIPLLARIYTIADSFEAMTSRRIYKRSKSVKEALEELEELSGIQFDPDLVPTTIKVLSGTEPTTLHTSNVDTELEKVRWSFYYVDTTGAIKGDLFLSTLNAFIDKGDPFCFTVFDIDGLFEYNRRHGWEEGNKVLNGLVNAINQQCCSMYDISDLVIKLMKCDVYDISSPVIFRIGGDEFAVIAPFIPPPEKVVGVANQMKKYGVDVRYHQLKFPDEFTTEEEILNEIYTLTKGSRFLHYIRRDAH